MDAAMAWLSTNVTPAMEVDTAIRCWVACKCCRKELELGDSLGTTTRQDLAWKAGKAGWGFRTEPPRMGWRCPDCSRPEDLAATEHLTPGME